MRLKFQEQSELKLVSRIIPEAKCRRINEHKIPKNKMHIPLQAINLIHKMMGEMLEKIK
jgi:hypothetical protein